MGIPATSDARLAHLCKHTVIECKSCAAEGKIMVAARSQAAYLKHTYPQPPGVTVFQQVSICLNCAAAICPTVACKAKCQFIQCGCDCNYHFEPHYADAHYVRAGADSYSYLFLCLSCQSEHAKVVDCSLSNSKNCAYCKRQSCANCSSTFFASCVGCSATACVQQDIDEESRLCIRCATECDVCEKSFGRGEIWTCPEETCLTTACPDCLPEVKRVTCCKNRQCHSNWCNQHANEIDADHVPPLCNACQQSLAIALVPFAKQAYLLGEAAMLDLAFGGVTVIRQLVMDYSCVFHSKQDELSELIAVFSYNLNAAVVSSRDLSDGVPMVDDTPSNEAVGFESLFTRRC